MDSSWLGDDLGSDTASVIIYAAVAVLVILALILCWFLLRRRKRKTDSAGSGKNNPRISVREVITVDERRRLVLIRRDNIEHLLLTGGDSDLVVESFPESISGNEESGLPRLTAQPAPANIKHLSNQRNASAPKKEESPADNAYTARPQPVPQSPVSHSKNNTPPKPRDAAPIPADFANRLGKQAGYPKDAFNVSSLPREQTENAGRNGNQPERRLMPDSDMSSYTSAPQSAGLREQQNMQDNRSAAPQMRERADELRPQVDAQLSAGQQPSADMRPSNQNSSDFALQDRRDSMRPDFSLRTAGREQRLGNTSAESSNIHDGRRNSGSAMDGGNNAGFGNEQRGGYSLERINVQPEQRAQEVRAQNFGADDSEHFSPSAQQRGGGGRQENNFNEPQTEIKNPASAGTAYAPYLGYMPAANIRPVRAETQRPIPQNQSRNGTGGAANPPHITLERGQNGMPNGTAEQRRLASDSAPSVNTGQFIRTGGNAEPGRTEQNNQQMNERRGIRQENGAGDFSAQSGGSRMEREPRQYASQRAGNEQYSRPRELSASGMNNQHNSGGITPPDDNDFDKILQDELMRSPNGTRFSLPHKKIGNGG